MIYYRNICNIAILFFSFISQNLMLFELTFCLYTYIISIIHCKQTLLLYFHRLVFYKVFSMFWLLIFQINQISVSSSEAFNIYKSNSGSIEWVLLWILIFSYNQTFQYIFGSRIRVSSKIWHFNPESII
jgi:hypothetical protein